MEACDIFIPLDNNQEEEFFNYFVEIRIVIVQQIN